jgi:hemerythrin superfamily protein
MNTSTIAPSAPAGVARSLRAVNGGWGEEPGPNQGVGAATKKEDMMATRTRSRSPRNEAGAGGGSRSSFRWGGGQAGVIAAAAVAGAAVGLAANYGRKMLVQGVGGAAGDWVDALIAEHRAVLALFDKLEATEDSQTWMRAFTLMKIRNALGKHALEEENVIYPALREANSAHDADALNGEHGYIKTYLYELENMPKSSPAWLERLRAFRGLLEEHIRMEEGEVFPALRNQLTDEQNARLGAAVNREGMKLA